MDLVVFGFKIEDPLETIGLLLVSFSFFATINAESAYIQIVTSGSVGNVSSIFFQAEDGVLWWFWNSIVGITDIERCRFLAFVLSPFIIALTGLGIVSQKIRFKDSI